MRLDVSPLSSVDSLWDSSGWRSIRPVTLGVAGFEAGYTPGSLLWIVNNSYFQYYSLMIFLVSVVVMVVVSHMTPAPATSQLTGLTYATMTAEQRRESRHQLGSDGPDWVGLCASADSNRVYLLQRVVIACRR